MEIEGEEGEATGEERRDAWSGEKRTVEWRAIENVSSQEEEAPGQRERKKKEREESGTRKGDGYEELGV